MSARAPASAQPKGPSPFTDLTRPLNPPTGRVVFICYDPWRRRKRSSTDMNRILTQSSRRLRSSRALMRGFTLIEIMVVVVIIGLLASIIVPQVIDRVDEARVAKAKQDIQGLETALSMFRLDNSKYPSTDQGLKALS